MMALIFSSGKVEMLLKLAGASYNAFHLYSKVQKNLIVRLIILNNGI
jgi:hypothetical protein